jgi:hypothetical protein
MLNYLKENGKQLKKEIKNRELSSTLRPPGVQRGEKLAETRNLYFA